MSSQCEAWVYLKNGKLMEHVENDGHALLRRGREATEREVTLDELRQSPALYVEAVDLLAPTSKAPLTNEYYWFCRRVTERSGPQP